jgi:hypothetical protein
LEFCDLIGFPNAKRTGTDALLLRLYGFWIIHPRTRCFILGKVILLLLLEYAFGGATTILLIITENKLPLGIKLPNI